MVGLGRFFAVLIVCSVVGACGNASDPTAGPATLTVIEAMSVGPPVNSVIVRASVDGGTIKFGQTLQVDSPSGLRRFVIDSIEEESQGEVAQAEKGQRVSLKIHGAGVSSFPKGAGIKGAT